MQGRLKKLLTPCIAALCLLGSLTAERHRVTIGIDIDESYIRAAVVRNGRVEVLKNDQGVELTPSYVAFKSNGRRFIGSEAKLQLTADPQNTVFSVFPFLGRRFDDASVQDQIARVPYRVYNRSGLPAIEVYAGSDRSESFAPEEIVAMLIRKMMELAEIHLNETVTGAVISVPGCLSYVQLQAMRDAGAIAGLNETNIVLASAAAAVAYHEHFSAEKAGAGRTILAVGISDSCTEASVILVTKDPSVEMLAHGSLRYDGGAQMQQRLMQHTMLQIEQKEGKAAVQKLAQNSTAMQQLYREIEMCIRLLPTSDQVRIQVQDIALTIAMSEFIEMNEALVRKMQKLVKDTLKGADRKPDDINDALLFGGATRVPGARRCVETAFSQSRILSEDALDPDRVSAIGAAIYAAQLDGAGSHSRRLVVLTVCHRTIGYRTDKGEFRASLRQNEVVPNDSDFDSTSVVPVQVFEKAGDGSERLEFVGNVTLDVPDLTNVPDLTVSFRMEKFCHLSVTITDLLSGTSKTHAFEHGLSQWRLRNMAGRVRRWAGKDRHEYERRKSQEDLESLAYRCLGDRTCKARTLALDSVSWMETSSDTAGAGDFATRCGLLAAAMGNAL